MSKNLTRKGLAFGALVALGSSVIAGAPANAAPTLTITPNAGTTYNVLTADDFEVAVYGSADLGYGQYANLKWEVTNSQGASLAYSAGTGTTAYEGSETATSTTQIVKNVNAATSGVRNVLTINPTTTSTNPTVTLQVRAFIDVDGNGAVTAGTDVVSQSETIKFLSYADVTPTVTLADLGAGEKATATVTLAPNVNLEQVTAGNLKAVFLDNSTAETGVNLGINSAKTALTVTDAQMGNSNDGVLAGADIVGVQLQAYNYDSGALKDLGSAVYKTVKSSTVDEIADLALANSAVIRTAISGDGSHGDATSLDKVAKTGTKAFTVTATVKDDAVAVAGAPVTVLLTKTALDSATEIKAGGVTLTSTDTTESFVVYSDAAGLVSIPFTSNNGTLNDEFTIALSSGTDSSGNDISVVWEDNKVAKLVERGINGGVRAITKGASLSLTYEAFDLFGQPFVDADHSYQVTVQDGTTVNSTANGTNANFLTSAPLTAGKATVTFSDNSTATGVYGIVADLEQKNTSNAWVASATTTGANGGWLGSDLTIKSDVSVVTAAQTGAAVTATVEYSNGTAANTYDDAYTTAIELGVQALTLKAVDVRADANTVSAPEYVNDNKGIELTGTVTDSTGAPVPGASVTVAAAGIAFKSGDLYTIGTITVNADKNGLYTVYAFSNTGGEVTYSVTSGTGTKTAKAKYTAVASDKGATLTITAPATTTPGRAVDVTVLLVDKYGNAVATDSNVSLSVRTSGVGSPTTIAANTDSAGKVSFKLVFGAAETGVATITASYDSNGATADVAGTTVVLAATATITVAAPVVTVVEPTSKIGTANSRVYVNVKDGKGSVVSVKIGAKWYTKTSLNNDYTFSFKAKAKSKVSVKVYVDGDLSSSKTIIVKK